MMTVWAVLGGFVLDAIFGDPAWLPHPVVYMGKAISRLEKFLRSRLPKTPQGELLGGAVLTEQVFTIPGFGKMIVDSVFNRDYAVVQGVVLIVAIGFLMLNLLADVLYVLINPKMRG